MALLDHIHRFTNADCKRMVDAGVFDEDANIEFLDGLFIEMNQQSPLHAAVIQRLTQLLAAPIDLLRVQLPLEAAGIPRCWLVDLPGERVFEYTDPRPHGYDSVETLAGDDVLDAHVDGIPTMTVAELRAR